MNAIEKSVLVVDDEPGMRLALQANFQREGWRVETAGGVVEAVRKFELARHSLVVTDMRMPDGDGLNVMRAVRTSSPSTAVILLTAFGSVPEAVEAMRKGACDYLTKPVSGEQLRRTVERVLGQNAAVATMGPLPGSRQILGDSPALRRALQRAHTAAGTTADILIEAESGTGKELLARYIHELSSRHNRPFVAVNCAAVPEHLLESELFGHVRGAFTGATAAKPGKFEVADGGTLLLDEIGEMPLDLQPKLLRVVQEREFERLGETRTIRTDIRVIATTNCCLQTMVDEGLFRADLYYRLNVIPLTLPPLRERPEDIPVLAQFFATKFAANPRGTTPAFSPEAMARLMRHSWPGNVRELSNSIRRIVAFSGDNVIDEALLELELQPPKLREGPQPQAGTSVRQLEKKLLETTLEATGGNRTRTAEMLGVSLRTVRNKIREYSLPPRRFGLQT